MTVAPGPGGNQTMLEAELAVDSAPRIEVEAPANNATVASPDVMFIWRTNTPSSGLLTVYPEGQPDQAQTFTTDSGNFHSVEVNALTPTQRYQWTIHADSDSACGTRTTDPQYFTVGNAIRFLDHTHEIEVYGLNDQLVTDISVQNIDSVPHTLSASVINPRTDLLLDFTGSGSLSEPVTLQPGDTHNLTLTVHAADAELADYQITAVLFSDQDTDITFQDNAVLNIHITREANFEIREIEEGYDPLTLGRKFAIINHNTMMAIPDLTIKAVDPLTGALADVYITPQVNHVQLELGESLEFMVYPIFSIEDVSGSQATRIPHLASMARQTPIEILFRLLVTGAGITKFFDSSANCSDGKEIYPVEIDDCILEFGTCARYRIHKWVTSKIFIPAWVFMEGVPNPKLFVSFGGSPYPLTGVIHLNLGVIGAFSTVLNDGVWEWTVNKAYLIQGTSGPTTQSIRIRTWSYVREEYADSVDLLFRFHIKNQTAYFCADSPENAQKAAEQVYPCKNHDPDTDVTDRSILNLRAIKTWISSIASDVGFNLGTFWCDLLECGDPINTHTGAYSFSTPDLSFATSAGDLVFQRSYSSASVDMYTDVLGYGWTHNHDMRLIFPDDPGGIENYVLLKDTFGNQLLFNIEADGSYTPGPGVLATLTKLGSETITYSVVTPEQIKLTFNANGHLLSRADAQGRAFAYTYDGTGKLSRVSADGGSRYIDLAYESGRIVSVTDHTGRSVSYTYDAAGDLVSATDLLENTWSFAYDPDHRIIMMRDPDNDQIVQTEYDDNGRAYRQFDGEGNLIVQLSYNADGSTTVTDGEGNSQTHQYNDNSVISKEIDELSRTTDTLYDSNLRPTSIANGAGHELAMVWSSDGINLLEKIDPAGSRTVYTYDDLNNLKTETDPNENVTSYEYTGTLLTSKLDKFGKTTTYTYTPEGFLETMTDDIGHTTSYTYDPHGQLETVSDWRGHMTSYVYDDLGRLVDTIDPRGRITHNVYDPAGQLLSTTVNYDPARPQNDENQYNIITSYTYDSRGNQVTITDTLGHVTRNEYDDNDRLVTTTVNYDPGRPQNDENQYNIITRYTYDDDGRMLTTTDSMNRTTTYEYDEVGRLKYTTDALGQLSGTTTYDIEHNTATATDAVGHAATYYYDALNRVIQVTDPLGNNTYTSYDELGNVRFRTDALGRVTEHQYDSLGRLTHVIDPLGADTETVYDENGNRSATIDPLGHQTTYIYDEQNRLVETIDPLDGHTINTYNEFGQLISVENALHQTTTSEYDMWGRLVASTDTAGRRTTYVYDQLDRVISTTGPTGTSSTTYDALGRVVAQTDEHSRTATTTYDALGRVDVSTDFDGNPTDNDYDPVGNLITTKVSLSPVQASITTYEYDELNRLIRTIDPLGNDTHQVYDILGNVTDTIDANGVVTHTEYDAVNRPIKIIENYLPAVLPSASVNVTTQYEYNEVGNRVAVIDPANNRTEFEYDAMNRVTKKTDPVGNVWQYFYDLAGNRISMTDGNDAETGFSYDANDQLILIDYPSPDDDVIFT